jgi:undecaprenyl-diphosphatase
MTILNALQRLDHTLFLWINGGPAIPDWLLVPAYFLACQLIYLVPLGLAGAWCWGNDQHRRLALQIGLAIILVLSINHLIGMAWHRPRPFVIDLGHAYFPHAPTPAFPSNHAGIIWAGGLVMASWAPRNGMTWLVLALGLGVAWARVYLGVHFPLDMAGALLTALLAWRLSTLLWSRLEEPIFRMALRGYHLLFAWPIAWKWFRD